MFSKLSTVLGILLVAALLSVRSLPVGDADDKTSKTTTPTDRTPLSIKSSTPVPGQSNPQKSGSEVLKSVDDRTRRDISTSTTPFPSLSYLPISKCEETDSTPGKVRTIAPSPPPAPPTPSVSSVEKSGSDVVTHVSDRFKRDTPSSTTVTPGQSTTGSTSSIPLKSGSDVRVPIKRLCMNKRQAPNRPTPSPSQTNPQKIGSPFLKPMPTRSRRAAQSSSTTTPSQNSSKNSSPIKVRRETQTTSTTPIPSQNQGNPLKSGADVLTPVTNVPSRIRRDPPSSSAVTPGQSTTASTSSIPLKSGSDVLTPVGTGRATQTSSTPTPNQSSSKNISPIKVRRETQTTSTTPNPSQNQGSPLKSGTDVLTPVTSIPSRIRRDTTSTTSAKPPANVASQKFGAKRPKVAREVTTTTKPTKQLL